MAKKSLSVCLAVSLLFSAGAAQAKAVDSSGLMGDLSLSAGVNSHYGLGLATAPALGWRFDFPLEVLLEPRFLFAGVGDHGSAGAALLGKARVYLFPRLSVEGGAGRGIFGGWPGEEWPPMAIPWIATAGASWTIHTGARTTLDVRCTLGFYSKHPADNSVQGPPDSPERRSAFEALFGLAMRLY